MYDACQRLSIAERPDSGLEVARPEPQNGSEGFHPRFEGATEIRMRTVHRLGTVLLALIVLAGCAVPTATPSPSVAPKPTPTSVPTPTPAPILTLQTSLLDGIGIGTDLYGICEISWLDGQMDAFRPPAVYDLSEGGRVTFTLDEKGYRVIGIQVEGQSAIGPVPDSLPVDDFKVRIGSLVLEPGSTVKASALAPALGTAAIDRTFDRSRRKVAVLGRDLVFAGVELGLYQALNAVDKDVWNVDSVGLLSAANATPRGLRTGLSTHEAVALFGTGDFLMGQLCGTPSVLDEMTVYHGADYSALIDSRVLVVHFLDGKVSRIDIKSSEFPQ